ncbi:MAG TPA: hypothetical protein DD670_19710 [Planctomycetaceae bacterium]|nr:hypothetical protein [Planctomycetaceae bacterium]
MKSKRKRPKLGDIIEIPLLSGKYAYGRLFRDYDIGIYGTLREERTPCETIVKDTIAFHSGFVDRLIRNGTWPIVGSQPFANDEEGWAPPSVVKDMVTPGRYRIYHKGELRPATPEEVEGLEESGMCSPENLVFEILQRLDPEFKCSHADVFAAFASLRASAGPKRAAKTRAMAESKFWALIDEAREEAGEVGETMVEALRDRLAELGATRIRAFDAAFNRAMEESYHNDLWAAAYVINGGCSDDGFDYFRGWLIALGREAYANAMRDPQTLKDYIPDDPDWNAELEEILYAAREAYEQKTETEMPPIDKAKWVLKGDTWDEESVYTRYPELAEAAEKRWGE